MMMDSPLTMPQMIKRAEMLFSKKEVISRTDKGISRLTYREIAERTRRLASSLEKLGVRRGDKVGTLAWNHHRHLEAYFAIPCSGAVIHTINIRLAPQQISYIINHAEDKVLLLDPDIIPILESCRDEIQGVKAFIIMTDEDTLPETTLSPVYHYEKLIADGDPDYVYPDDIPEQAPAGMCYTSATTGNPKGVVYTHRSIFLHSLALGLADSVALSERDVAMPVVPMFHVNAWGMPFAGAWFGTTQVLPGPNFTPKILIELIEQEKVTFSAGVPTIWLGVLKELETGKYDVSSLRGILCGGAPAPKEMIRRYEQKYQIPFIHGYGMTETSPIVTISKLKSYQEQLPYEERLEIRSKQGLIVPGIEMKVVSAKGEAAWDGREMGELALRGPWIASEYYQDDRSKETFKDGWLYTGDVVTVDGEGFLKIVDRTKDIIKSGGEWISSVDLENALMAHEAVFEAAVVAVPHKKWQERPVACVVLKENASVTEEELLDFLRPQFAKWWLPDKILFLNEIPKTSVGKFLKRALREEVQKVLEAHEGLAAGE